MDPFASRTPLHSDSFIRKSQLDPRFTKPEMIHRTIASNVQPITAFFV